MCFFISKRSSSVRSKIIIMMRLNLSINSLIQTNQNKLTTTFIITNKHNFLKYFYFWKFFKKFCLVFSYDNIKKPPSSSNKKYFVVFLFYLFLRRRGKRFPFRTITKKKQQLCIKYLFFWNISKRSCQYPTWEEY